MRYDLPYKPPYHHTLAIYSGLDTHSFKITLASVSSFGTIPKRSFLVPSVPPMLSMSLCPERRPRSRLPPVTGREGFQVSLKILKVILCSDFLALDIIHHFPD